MEISLLKPAICDQVANLHMHHLSTHFKGTAGQKLLTKYYHAVCTGKGATGFIAQRDGEILGYVCGIWNPVDLRNILLRKHWLGLAWCGFCQLLSKPSLLNDYIGRLRSHNLSDSYSELKSAPKFYELRPIVVSPNARGSGLALQLVEYLIGDARIRGFHSMCLYVEQDNIAAQRFYKRVGFHEVDCTLLQRKEHLYFELAIA